MTSRFSFVIVHSVGMALDYAGTGTTQRDHLMQER
jgi:hypothetical protein